MKIKSLRSCKLIITDANLKLSPGQVITVNSLSPETENLIAMGYIAKVEESSTSTVTQNSEPAKEPENKEVSVRKDYDSLHAPEAIEYVMSLTDPQVLQAILKQEKRKSVLDAIIQRIAELSK